jgi:archaemetzincin
MNPLEIVRIGPFDPGLAERLGRELASELHVPFLLGPVLPEPSFAYHPERCQFHSSEILGWLEKRAHPDIWRTLAVTDADLYIPILTFVFGEARLGPGAAIVSTHRLHQEFYGLPPDADLLFQRLLREAIHEMGHTLGLRHCEDYGCAMAGSPGVEWIDLKGSTLCDFCKTRVGLLEPAANR